MKKYSQKIQLVSLVSMLMCVVACSSTAPQQAGQAPQAAAQTSVPAVNPPAQTTQGVATSEYVGVWHRDTHVDTECKSGLAPESWSEQSYLQLNADGTGLVVHYDAHGAKPIARLPFTFVSSTLGTLGSSVGASGAAPVAVEDGLVFTPTADADRTVISAQGGDLSGYIYPSIDTSVTFLEVSDDTMLVNIAKDYACAGGASEVTFHRVDQLP